MAQRVHGGSTTRGRRPAHRGASAFAAGGMDDIARGNVGTGDQGPADVYPEDPITVHTGELPVGEVAPPVHPWTPLVERALAAGHLEGTDPASGHVRAMYAPCPNDGASGHVWRVARGAAHAVVEVTMHCPACGAEFTADPDAIFLR